MLANGHIFAAPPRRYVFPAREDGMPCGSIGKDPVEQFPIGVDWTRQLPPGRTLSRVVGSAIDLADNSAAAILVSTTGTLSGFVGTLTVKAGVVGHRYKIFLDFYDTAAGHYRQSLILIVRPA